MTPNRLLLDMTPLQNSSHLVQNFPTPRMDGSNLVCFGRHATASGLRRVNFTNSQTLVSFQIPGMKRMAFGKTFVKGTAPMRPNLWTEWRS